MLEISTEIKAQEIHEKAIGYYKLSEEFGYKFLMEVKQIRDERLFIDLGFENFGEYVETNFNYSRRTINERIATAEAWGEEYKRALARLGKHKAKQLGVLPKEVREKVISDGIPTDEGMKRVDEATTREVEEYKRQLKQKDDQIKNLSNTITEMNNKKPVTIEKKVVIEKKPDDYEFYKERTEVLQEEVKQLEESYRDLLKKRSEVDEKSLKYEELTKAINQAKGELGDTQKIISNYADLSKLLKESNEFLLKASGLVYSDLTEVIERDGIAKQELDFLISRLERFTSDLIGLTQNNILEGEIING